MVAKQRNMTHPSYTIHINTPCQCLPTRLLVVALIILLGTTTITTTAFVVDDTRIGTSRSRIQGGTRHTRAVAAAAGGGGGGEILQDAYGRPIRSSGSHGSDPLMDMASNAETAMNHETADGSNSAETTNNNKDAIDSGGGETHQDAYGRPIRSSGLHSDPLVDTTTTAETAMNHETSDSSSNSAEVTNNDKDAIETPKEEHPGDDTSSPRAYDIMAETDKMLYFPSVRVGHDRLQVTDRSSNSRERKHVTYYVVDNEEPDWPHPSSYRDFGETNPNIVLDKDMGQSEQ